MQQPAWLKYDSETRQNKNPEEREKSHRKSAAREEKAMMALREFSSQSPE